MQLQRSLVFALLGVVATTPVQQCSDYEEGFAFKTCPGPNGVNTTYGVPNCPLGGAEIDCQPDGTAICHECYPRNVCPSGYFCSSSTSWNVRRSLCSSQSSCREIHTFLLGVTLFLTLEPTVFACAGSQLYLLSVLLWFAGIPSHHQWLLGSILFLHV
jgi:hypothetical protein